MSQWANPAAFWVRVDIRTPQECWLWQGSGHPYGQVRVGGRMVGAHRVAWILAHGRPIPRGQVIAHSCDTPRCVNPAHLEATSQAQNISDAVARGRAIPKWRNG